MNVPSQFLMFGINACEIHLFSEHFSFLKSKFRKLEGMSMCFWMMVIKIIFMFFLNFLQFISLWGKAKKNLFSDGKPF